ncbi:hypothetical protein MTR_0827s0020 [Medicago truncatula]|uniref:Uncharacterized protein n=1 Tax=Medicago truncatula TaxID=3880 RepID=A0A072TDC3_MEDTR|nr:hypothetical protein MTR_0827s0020 [Medicago truncatula]
MVKKLNFLRLSDKNRGANFKNRGPIFVESKAIDSIQDPFFEAFHCKTASTFEGSTDMPPNEITCPKKLTSPNQHSKVINEYYNELI